MDIKRKIALVDDHESVLDSLKILFEHMKFDVSTYSGAEGLIEDYQMEKRFDCILIDLRLEGISGLQFIKENQEIVKKTPVVLISSFAKAKIVKDALEFGAFSVIDKPYEDQELWDTVVSAINIKKQTESFDKKKEEIAQGFSKITNLEKETLKKIINGNEVKAIAYDEGVSNRTIELRRKSVLSKLGANNIAQACVYLNLINEFDNFSTQIDL